MAIQTNPEKYCHLFPEVNLIQDPALREGVIDIWMDLAAETSWERFEDIPKNLTAEKHMTLVGHIQGVTRMAIAMADIAEDLHGIDVDREVFVLIGTPHGQMVRRLCL